MSTLKTKEQKKCRGAYSRKSWVAAVNLSALLGWLLINIVILIGTSGSNLADVLAWFLWAGIVGLPIAFGICWIFVAPFVGLAMRRPLSWRASMIWGAAAASTMTGLIVVFAYIAGLIWTSAPISVRATQMVVVMVGGVFIGAFLRFVIGDGKQT